ncbi:MAG: hypothetical protein ACK4HB_03100 [Candidatus Bipolaricaulia bacterium]
MTPKRYIITASCTLGWYALELVRKLRLTVIFAMAKAKPMRSVRP